MNKKVCPTCKGRGKEVILSKGMLFPPIVQPCPQCRGKGYVEIAK